MTQRESAPEPPEAVVAAEEILFLLDKRAQSLRDEGKAAEAALLTAWRDLYAARLGSS